MSSDLGSLSGNARLEIVVCFWSTKQECLHFVVGLKAGCVGVNDEDAHWLSELSVLIPGMNCCIWWGCRSGNFRSVSRAFFSTSCRILPSAAPGYVQNKRK